MVCITGQVASTAIGTDAFQECDTVGITRSVTKHNELVMRAEDIRMIVRQAFHIATTGRPGPVLVDVPKDVLVQEMEVLADRRRGRRVPPGLPPQHQGPPA
ncbi:MAG: thiamine pyrophosphate-binding protein [Ilumatobacteraceae bacterium]